MKEIVEDKEEIQESDSNLVSRQSNIGLSFC